MSPGARDEYWARVPDVLTPTALAGVLRRADESMYRWLRSGKLPGHRVLGNWVIYKETVRASLEHPDEPFVLPNEFIASFPELMTVQETARFFGMTTQTIYEWLWSSKLPGTQLGSTWTIYRGELAELLEKSANWTSSGESEGS